MEDSLHLLYSFKREYIDATRSKKAFVSMIDRCFEHCLFPFFGNAQEIFFYNTSRVLVTGLLERIVFSRLPAQPCDHREWLWESFGLRFQGWRMVERSQPSERFFRESFDSVVSITFEKFLERGNYSVYI